MYAKDRKRPITKWTLYYLSVIKTVLIVSAGVGILLMGIGLVFYFRGSTTLSELFLLGIIGPIGLALILAVFLSPPALRGLYLLRRQERYLGFCFRAEMKQKNITKPIYRSSDWFIDISNPPTVLALQRDYIVRLEKRKIIKGNRGNRYRITLVGADGKKQTIEGAHASIIGLQTWFRKKPDLDTQRSKTNDKTKNQN